MGLVVAVASLLVPAPSRVLAQDVPGIGQAPSLSNYLLAQANSDPDEVLYELVNAYLEAGNLEQALATANRISDPLSQSSALSDITETYAEVGNFDQAFAVVNKIEDPKVSSEAFDAITEISRNLESQN